MILATLSETAVTVEVIDEGLMISVGCDNVDEEELEGVEDDDEATGVGASERLCDFECECGWEWR